MKSQTGHIFLIGSQDTLNIKKDSSLLLAHALKEKGESVFILFEKDFSIIPAQQCFLTVREFQSQLKEDSYYMDSFIFESEQQIEVGAGWTLHMRSDPPVDQRYTRYLWMLSYLKTLGIRVTNDPSGIIQFNEKLVPYQFLELSDTIHSYYGEDSMALGHFLKELKVPEVIVKPMDSFSGIGVEKLNLSELGVEGVRSSVAKRAEAVIVQPFIDKVYEGEKRSLYLGKKLIGVMTKVPKGSFLANIAQGASFHKSELTNKEEASCQTLADKLFDHGIDFIAFDILDERVTEVNITCPGLVNEVSTATQNDIAAIYADYFRN